MSELREKLTYMAQEYGEQGREILTSDFVNAILSLLDSSPTEFEAVRKCDCGGGRGFACYHCLKCNMTGEIVRPMTQKEVMEWAEGVVECGIEWPNTLAKTLINLPSGERVRKKP